MFIPVPLLRGSVVTFDKGGRVPRLGPGVHLDARQTGILFAQLGTGNSARLLDWDRDRDPNATERIEGLLKTKGPDHKQTLLLALSMGVLIRFEVQDGSTGTTVELVGDRSEGYHVQPSPDS